MNWKRMGWVVLMWMGMEYVFGCGNDWDRDRINVDGIDLIEEIDWIDGICLLLFGQGLFIISMVDL